MTGPIPDPLRRFVLVPYVAILARPGGDLHIESNDAALTEYLLEHFRNVPPSASLHAIEHLKLVVEHRLPQDGEDLTQLDSGHLRTVLRGTNSMVIYDSESCELLAFLAQGVSCEEFVQRLLPALVITNG